MLIRLLRTYLRPYSRLLCAVVVLQLIQAIANLYLPRLNADIIDRGVSTGDSDFIWTAGLTMLGMSTIQIIATVCAVYLGAKIAAGFGRDLRAAIFHRIGTFSAREVGEFGAPTLITRTTNDVQQVQILALMTTNMLLVTPITVIGGVAMAVREDAQLSWLLAICIPAMVISLGIVVSRLVPQYRAMQTRIDKINQVLREQLTGMRVVRAFVREQHETDRFAAANTDVTITALKVGRLMAAMFPVVMLVFNASSVGVLWFGAQRVADSHLQVGELIAFITYLMQILMSVMMATFVASMIPRAAVCADRISEVLNTSSSVIPPSHPIDTIGSPASLEIKNAGFHYPGADDPVLRNITFSIHAGQTTAIIGSTGSGKTTLLNLIPRLIDTTSGSVFIGDVDVRELSSEKLASTVGLVPQHPYLFSGTVSSNLRYGNPQATDEQLWEALKIAQAEDFVRAMPEQLETPVSQGGTTVSGGQRQRLAIARALVHQPQIYLFDDSFSALDMATDARLRAALKPHTTNAAVVIVAQRVSTISQADQIVVIDDGAIVGIDAHTQLLIDCPTYKEIVESQLTAEEAA